MAASGGATIDGCRACATFTILRFWAGFWLLRRQCFCP
jgi:hypothetical protein